MDLSVDIPLSERQRRLLDVAERLAERFVERAGKHDREASFPFENFADLREARLLALTVPEEYGGLGANELDFALLLERIAWGDASTALALGRSEEHTSELQSHV